MNNKNTAIGKVSHDIDTNRYVKEVILFVEQKINLFPKYLKDSLVLQGLTEDNAEDKITEHVAVFLNIKEQSHIYRIEKQDNMRFQFMNQPKGIGHKRYDIGFFLANEDANCGKIFVFEAKRLPTPGTDREMEYVVGGGIDRFKTEVYGQEVRTNLLSMFAYIQSEPVAHWHEKVNAWISQQINDNKSIQWNTEDLLKKDNSFPDGLVSKYTSRHTRKSLDPIELYHYWIDLRND